MRRKGELSSKQVDANWPYQVALSAATTTREFEAIRAFVRTLSIAPRGHAFYRDGADYNVYCFSVPEHAELFRATFGGEAMTPHSRPRWRQPKMKT